MEEREKVLCRPESEEGPSDAVQMKTGCIRTDFTENPDGGIGVDQKENSDANITASYEFGYFSIRDKGTGVMLTVSFDDVVVLMAAALDAAKEKDADTEAQKPEE